MLLPDEGYRYQQTVYDDDWLAAQGYGAAAQPAEPVEVSAPDRLADTWSRYPWGRRTYRDAVGHTGPVRVEELEHAW